MWQIIFQVIVPIILIPILLFIYWRLRLKKLANYKSEKLGEISVIEKYDKERVLTINYYAQGISIEKESIKKSYWYTAADITVNHCKNIKNPKLLMLGLGAGTISSLIEKLSPTIHQTIVEFDDKIIQACKEYFNLEKLSNYLLIHNDIYKLFNKRGALKNNFDVIIVDIFTGNAPFVDVKSNQANFIQKVLKYLKKDGLIIFNRPAHTRHLRKGSVKLREHLATLFHKTKLLDIRDPRGYRNNIIIGVKIQKR